MPIRTPCCDHGSTPTMTPSVHGRDAAGSGQVPRRSRRATRSRSWCWATAPVAASTALDLDLLARKSAGSGITVVRFEQPWRYGRAQGGGATAATGRGLARRAELAGRADVGRAAAGRRRPKCRCPGGLPDRRRMATPPRSSASPSRCTCPADLRSPGCRAAGPHVPRLVLQGTRTPSAARTRFVPRSAPGPGITVVDLPGADHGYRTASRPTGAGGVRARPSLQTATCLVATRGAICVATVVPRRSRAESSAPWREYHHHDRVAPHVPLFLDAWPTASMRAHARRYSRT